ncbi:MAG: putative DNA binding domain-containing protein [Flavobacteriaceae bacterium]|nr:putative DNA binding domain-containing protein [Flavobacteriaceae bacterium]
MPENITKSMLNRDMEVEVNPRSDKSRKIIVKGIVSEVLTSKESHPHGILVRLTDGTEGRVKRICSSEIEDSIPRYESSDINSSLSHLIRDGENHFIEFKTSILWSKYLTKQEIEDSKSYDLKRYGQNTSKIIIAKSLCGFLNSEGGSLIIGIKETKDSDDVVVVGIESEYTKLKDKTQDGYRRMILDEVIKPYLPSQIFNHFNEYLTFKIEEIEGKTVLGIIVKPSDFRVFVSVANEDVFFVRIDASTRKLAGPELVDYCTRRFK